MFTITHLERSTSHDLYETDKWVGRASDGGEVEVRFRRVPREIRVWLDNQRQGSVIAVEGVRHLDDHKLRRLITRNGIATFKEDNNG